MLMLKRILLVLLVMVLVSPVVMASQSDDLTVKAWAKYQRAGGKVTQILHLASGVEIRDSSSTGFFVNKDGLMLTNCHVVSYPPTMQAITIFGVLEIPVIDCTFIYTNTETGVEYQAKFVAKFKDSDLGTIKVDIDPKDYDAVELGNSDNIKVGQQVCIMGCPLGEKMGITSGIISCLRNDLGYVPPKGNLMRTDAAIDPGSSGSIIVDENLKVIGIINSMIPEAHAMGYGIPINLYNLPFWQTIND